MGVCCGKNDKVKEPVLVAAVDPTPPAGPPISSSNLIHEKGATQTGATLATGLPNGLDSLMGDQIPGFHIYGGGGHSKPVSPNDKPKSPPEPNYPKPEYPKFVPDPQRQPGIDHRNRAIHPSFNPQDPHVPNPPAAPTSPTGGPNIVIKVDNGPFNPMKKDRLPENLNVLPAIPENEKTVPVESRNLIEVPQIALSLKPLPSRLPPAPESKFRHVTGGIKLLHPTTLQIDIPANKRFINSIRQTPWSQADAYEFLSAGEVLMASQNLQTATVSISKPSSRSMC